MAKDSKKRKKGKKGKKGKKTKHVVQKDITLEDLPLFLDDWPTEEDVNEADELLELQKQYEAVVDKEKREREEKKEPKRSETLSPEVVNGLTLIVGPDDGTIDNADVRVRWCVTPELTKYLIDAGVKDPHIVLSTCAPNGKHEWRGVFPLNQVITYARFYMAGTMNLYACIIDMGKDVADRKNTMLKWTTHDYESYNHMLQQKGNYYRTIDDSSDIFAVSTEAVVIPAGVFQTEPPKWLDWFVNLWHGKHKNDDGCEFRRRAALAFTLKWIPMTIWTMCYTFVMGLIYLIWKGLGLKSHIMTARPIFHPFDGTATALLDTAEGKWGDIRDSKFVLWATWRGIHAKQKIDYNDGKLKQPLYTLLAFTPSWFLFMASMSWLAASDLGNIWLTLHEAHEILITLMMLSVSLLFVWDVSMAIGIAFLLYVFDDDCIMRYERNGEMLFGEDHGHMGKAGVITFVCFWLAAAAFNAMPWFIFLAILTACVIVGGLIIFLQLPIFDRWWNAINRWTDRVYDRLYVLFGAPDDYTEMRELLCPKDKENLSTDINSLPGSNVAWRLKIRNLKAMVCKPRQRR